MSDDRKLDPVTGDFVNAAGGEFEQCEWIENAIGFSFMIPVGSWEGDPTLGHEFAELDRAQNTQENRNRLRDLAKKAIKWLVDGGFVETVTVTVEQAATVAGMDRVPWQVDYTRPGQKTVQRVGPFLIPVGV